MAVFSPPLQPGVDDKVAVIVCGPRSVRVEGPGAPSRPNWATMSAAANYARSRDFAPTSSRFSEGGGPISCRVVHMVGSYSGDAELVL
jgi:hypothetical protein